MFSDTDNDDHYYPSLRLIEIEKKSAQCGFHLTRSKFDPYPWVSKVDENSVASAKGVKPGDCVIEVNGIDIVGKRISDIAEIVKSKSEQVSLLLWNAGIDAKCTPETLCCGPIPSNVQRLVLCVSKILTFLECPVCLETVQSPTYQCTNGHLICIRCRSKTERCPVCRIRLHRGRSLLADHVLTTITDSFSTADESDSSRLAQIHKIFKQKQTKRNIPDIKITESFSNKLFSKIVGKSSSVDNISSAKYLSPNKESGDLGLKIKSLSENGMFITESPGLSRNGSYSRLSSNSLNIEINESRKNRPASYHGSIESLDRKIDSVSPVSSCLTSTEEVNDDSYSEFSCYCPFSKNCTVLLKGSMIFEHFIKEHSCTGSLIQYFTPTLEIYLGEFKNSQELCYIINSLGQTFFLKIILGNEEINNTCDIILWVWHQGCKTISRNYGVQFDIKNVLTKEVLLSTRTTVHSLNSTSYLEIEEFNKGVYLRYRSTKALGFPSNELIVETKIFENDI